MNVLTVSGFSVLVLLHLSAASEQQPRLTRCTVSAKPENFFRRGAQDVLPYPATLDIGSFLKIVNVTADYKRLAKKVEMNVAINVNRTFGSSPTLEIYVSAVGVKSRSCDLSASPEELSLCGGTTHTEKKLASEWGNECPIQAGTYNSELSFKVRPSRTAKSCLKENPLLVTLKIRDEGVILDCVSFRVATHH